MKRKVSELKGKSAARRHAATPLRVSVVDMAELHDAIDAGLMRAKILMALGRSLEARPIELAADEEIVRRLQLGPESASAVLRKLPLVLDDGKPALDRFDVAEAEVVFIAKRSAVPRLRLTADDPRLAELARVIARGAAER